MNAGTFWLFLFFSFTYILSLDVESIWLLDRLPYLGYLFINIAFLFNIDGKVFVDPLPKGRRTYWIFFIYFSVSSWGGFLMFNVRSIWYLGFFSFLFCTQDFFFLLLVLDVQFSVLYFIFLLIKKNKYFFLKKRKCECRNQHNIILTVLQ